MDRGIVVLLVVAIAALGLATLLGRLREQTRIASLVSEFGAKLGDFAESVYVQKRLDNSLYEWLTKKVVKVQSEIGGHGIVAMYRPPFANYALTIYPILLNTLPEIARGTAHKNDIGACLEALLRYSGAQEEYIDALRGSAKNPIRWFQEGIRSLLVSPIFLLHWLGLTGTSLVNRVAGSPVTTGISGIIALITLLSALVTLVVGWSQFTQTVSTAFSRLLNR